MQEKCSYVENKQAMCLKEISQRIDHLQDCSGTLEYCTTIVMLGIYHVAIIAHIAVTNAMAI